MKILLFILLSMNAYAARVNTSEGNKLPSPSKEEIVKTADRIQIPRELKIPENWLPYLNPAFEEFWSEGNHRPDTGFVLFARNPSVENAKLWLIRMETKAKYLQLMLNSVMLAQKELISSGVIKDRYNMVTTAKALPHVKKDTNISVSKQEIDQIEIFFLFSSKCPHCKALAQTLKSFNNVSPLQVDIQNELLNFENLAKTEIANEETINSYVKQGEVPVLILHDTKASNINILKGNRTQEEIILAMASLINARASEK